MVSRAGEARESRVHPSPRESRRERERGLRREDILVAASQVFAEKGFHEAQVGQIATRAEVSLASVYQHFPSKESMFEAVLGNAASAIDVAVRQRVEAIEDPAKRLLAVGDALFACFEQNQDLLRIYARVSHGRPWRATANALDGRTRKISDDFTAWLADLARDAERDGALRGLDPDVFASALIGAVVTIALRAIESDEPAALDRVAPQLRTLFARTLGGPAS